MVRITHFYQKRTFVTCLLLLLALAVTAQKKDVTIADIWRQYSFFPESIDEIRSMNDGNHYTVLEDRGASIVKYSYENGEKIETILEVSALNNNNVVAISDYEFSRDESKILFYTNQERIYRRSFTADYYIYDIKTKKVTSLSENGRQQLGTFSPDGSKVAFVRKNNLYYKDLNTGKEIQITSDGEYNKILNGIPDWVYEEEFEFNRAFEWSPDSRNLAFIRFDESDVKMFSMIKYQGQMPQIEKNKLYPEVYTFKYPKAGDDNSLVSVHIYNLESKKMQDVDIGQEKDQYIPRIRWTASPDNLCVFRLNRLQNKLELLFADPQTGKTKVIYEEENKFYIDEKYFDFIQFLDDNKHFVMVSEKDGYAHLYLFDLDGKQIQQLTKGEYVVTDFYGYDKKKKVLYYQAAENSPTQREVYAVKINGKNKKKMSEKTGTNRAEFSSGFQYYINEFSSAKTPPVYTLHNIKGKMLKTLEENKDLSEKLESYNHSYKEFFSFTTSEGIKLNAWILKPHDFDPTKSYPVMITQYSGPNSQSVTDEWIFGWEQALADKGYIVACTDPRGTGARGEAFCKSTYMQLGKYETIDLIEFAKYLGKQSYIDKDRIAIWGWSYGGFMTLNCLTKGADYFKAGIAVAPVTNWRYYDNIYTERFMRKPQDNANGYDDNSPIFHAEKLKGKLLICHGSADDNVHIQNSWEMIERLVQANKQFEMQFYNNRNHSIYGGNTRFHIFTRFVNFLDANL